MRGFFLEDDTLIQQEGFFEIGGSNEQEKVSGKGDMSQLRLRCGLRYEW
jgi:hypothetical protein